LVLVCPEVIGGLATPRARAEIVGGNGFDVLDGRAKVMTVHGDDVTAAYLDGARQVLATAEATGAAEAVLQDYSPSCGCRMISDGSFTKNRIEGVGVTAALLIRHELSVVAHHEFAARSRPRGDGGE